MIYDYIKENSLQLESDKRVIDTSGEKGLVLRRLFHLEKEEVLQFKNFQTYMARLYNRENLPEWKEEPVVTKKAKGKSKRKGGKKSKKSKTATSSSI